MKETNGTSHSKDLKKNDDRISAYFDDDSNGNCKSDKSVLEVSLLHNICGEKIFVQREAISDHTYRKILGKEIQKYQQ